MADNKDFFYYIVKNKDIVDFIETYKLPFSDIPEEELEEFRKKVNRITTYKLSNYYIGQPNIYDDDPKINEPFDLIESGYYYLTLSGPGYLNQNNYSKFIANWKKIPIKDELTINKNFTWSRIKEIDLGFFLHWYGTYSYAKDLVIFSLTKQGYQIGEGVPPLITENYIKYFGLMYGPIENNHVLKDTRNGYISGLISEDVSGLITGTASGIATIYATGDGFATIKSTISGYFGYNITQDITDTVIKSVTGEVSGIIENDANALGYGPVENIQISGKLIGNLNALLSNPPIICIGEGNVNRGVEGTTNLKNFLISGDCTGLVKNVIFNKSVTRVVDNIYITGLATGTTNNNLFTANVSGIANNISVSGLISNTINDISISGLIKETVNDVLLSGMVSGKANEVPVSGMASGIISNSIINGTISGIVNNVNISGFVEGTTNNVTINGIINEVIDEVEISGIITGTIQDEIKGYILSGIAYGVMYIDPTDLINNSVITSTKINTFKTTLFNSISGIIGSNEIIFFGKTADEIKISLSGAIENIIDYDSLYNIIIPTYLSKSSIMALTNDLLLYMILSNGNYMSNNITLTGSALMTGTLHRNDTYSSLSGSLSTDDAFTMLAGNLHINDAYGSLNGNLSLNTNITLQSPDLKILREKIILTIKNSIISMLDFNLNQTVYYLLQNTLISGNINGTVSGLIKGIVQNNISKDLSCSATGYAAGLISGEILFDTNKSVGGNISGFAEGTISGIGYGKATILASCLGLGSASYSSHIILNSFLDDTFSDFTNFYKINGSNIIGEYVNDIVNPGGRGQLLNSVIVNTSDLVNTFYDVGSYIDNTNTQFKISDSFILQATSGIFSEFPNYSDYFGGKGGNTELNSFDFYEKHELTENGFIKLIYAGPNEFSFRSLEIVFDKDAFSVLPDTTSKTINGNLINTILTENEAIVYYRLLKRSEELDLEKSILNGIPLKNFTVKYKEPEVPKTNDKSYNYVETLLHTKYDNNELYIIELDNFRRKLAFKTPFQSIDSNNPTNIKLELIATDRKFYFAIARDYNIDTVKINNILFDPDDQDEDFVYRKYKQRDEDNNVILDQNNSPIYLEHEFKAGKPYDMTITFKTESASLMKELLINYLHDCDINFVKANNFMQTISFIMPERDVLLFLKTEDCYFLTILKDELNSNFIEEIEHSGDTLTKFSQIDDSIMVKHFKDDEIIINFLFNDPFYELDREYLESQLLDVGIILYNDDERERTQYKGYDISVKQTIKFLMPARNVTLYIKQKDYRVFLKLLREKSSTHFTHINITGHEDKSPFELKTESDKTIDNDNNFNLSAFPFYANEEIIITVLFIPEDGLYYWEIDEPYMKSQMIDILIGERLFKFNKSDGFEDRYQIIKFLMPNNDVKLIIKEKNIRSIITIRSNEYQTIYSGETRKIEKIYYKNISYSTINNSNKLNPLIIQEITGTIIDLYIKFTDIYQCLDKQNLYSQKSNIFIENPGNFINLVNNSTIPSIPDQILPDDIHFPYSEGKTYSAQNYIENLHLENSTRLNTSNYNVLNDKEFYQHIRFIMTDGENQILDLRWIERYYMLNLNYKQEFIESIQILDSNLLTLKGHLNEAKIELNKTIFPYETYASVYNKSATSIKESIYTNLIKIDVKLKPFLKLKIESTPNINSSLYSDDQNSYYTLDDQLEKPVRFNNPDTYFNSIYDSQQNRQKKLIFIDTRNNFGDGSQEKPIIDIKMPKKNLNINFIIQMKDRLSIVREGFSSDSLTLDKGFYFIKLNGASGGRGASVGDNSSPNRQGLPGKKGGALILGLQFSKSFTLNYMLGQMGQDAPFNSGGRGSGGGGGGAGGNSLIYFNCSFEDMKIQYCYINGQPQNISTYKNSLGNFKYLGMYCNGGRGGNGGWGRNASCGWGGYPNFVIGTGSWGGSSGWSYQVGGKGDQWIGYAGPGGPGGLGWHYKNLYDRLLYNFIEVSTWNVDGFLEGRLYIKGHPTYQPPAEEINY
jgi:hypothetical protein